MPLPSEAKFFADLAAAGAEDDTHLLALQQGSPPVGGATPTPTRKWSLSAVKSWILGFLGTAAQAATGPGLTQVPTGQDFESVQEASVGEYCSRVPIPKIGITSSNQTFYLLLSDEGTNLRSILAGSIYGHTQEVAGSGGSFYIALTAVGDPNLSGGDGLVFSAISTSRGSTANGILKARAVRLMYSGKQWLALELSGTHVFQSGLSAIYFKGFIRIGSPFNIIAVGDTSVSSVTALSNPNGGHSGRPGDSIGLNQSLHISGSPGTSKEVMVDGSGFIVEV